ncbi:fibro-slime domain-containing protein [Mediterraneibacter faecis]|uniref:fibro-slime domain-containing protein n=4 Tax=Bacteria TaxID=2 RepID=UPI001D07F9D6|nr:fibro-slime domain-containing protein [Mediterraneibacter faecis]MCB5921435.1 fibro-slime domain-containing protein [Lachnospiraceae bacterium 210521-DFI.1.105]MCB6299568.1 fibro-slime domain-containing protein [Mediterraneibacter faecis]MCB6446364.1 fibro-slime domain-containing protein [Mediterraneibacter faecis]MCQ5258282.1 fibro-slime domain-containing protein [Mediterraneibacter faecis]MCQ5261340.1 fibro-slime domain-containing protein [Mediterraneibacter faecis]
MWGSDGEKLSNGNNATQGLVADQLSNNDLQLKTKNGTALAPFFDKDFLNGNNSKNTVLGKVYENVTFPFVKKAMSSSSTKSTGKLDYWYFNSADQAATTTNKNLQLKYDATDEYFLQSNNEEVKGSTTNGNYFPLNSSKQSGKASQLNYGFGQKFDLKFRLTSDGKVLDSANNEVPIEFNFSGDDDVWVFIDGQLVLDIGGDHAVVTGRIDFANKKATVSSAKNSSSGGISNGEVEKDFPKELNTENYFTKEHTLTMFYMERGLWESNMQITFNFPQENKLTVEKEVDTSGANEIFKDALADVGTFDFEIKNLATSGTSKEVSKPSSPEERQVFNDYTDQSSISGTGVKNSSVEVVNDSTGNGKGKLISSYYPGEKKSTDTQEKTDSRLVKIQASGGGTFDASDSKGYKYLQFDVYNKDENASGTDPFVALVDEDGTRIGAWASSLTYNGRNNNIDNKIWKTIRIDLNKLKEKTLDEETTRGFNFSKVKEIQFAYWDDVTVYLDKFAFVKPASVEKTGFTTEQEDIPDYGSIESEKLELVNGAYYQNTNGDTIIYSDGLLSIGNKEKAVFSDQFRRGSYLSIAEKNVSSDVFTTTWSLYENGAIVNPGYLNPTGSTTVTGNGQKSVENQSGYAVNDGRTEQNEIVGKPNESTIVFRSYANPDSVTAVIDLKAKYVNKLRTGSISLKKELSKGEEESKSGRKYQFIIEYRNVAGMKLEANMGEAVITQPIELEAGQNKTIEGIPAGTDYTIYEVIPNGADYSLEKVNVTNAGNDKNVKAENNVVTGIVVADDGVNPTSTDVTFVNTVTPLISISGTKTWEGGETADTPDNIVVQIQRFNPDTNKYEQAKDKSGELIPNQVVDINSGWWKYTFTGLLKYVNYQASTQQEYKYRVVELGTLKSLNELKGRTPDPQNLDHIKQIAGYYPEYTTATDGSSYNITNRKTGSLKIIKKTGKNESLAGAKFTLYKDAEATQVATDCTGIELTGITGDNGELVFNNIKAGTEEKPITYYLKEVKTKAGYVLLKEPIKITLPYKYKVGDIVNGTKVKESGVTWNLTYTIINDKAFDLPASGNKGIFKFIVIGITAVLVGGYLLTARKKSRKKRVSRRG